MVALALAQEIGRATVNRSLNRGAGHRVEGNFWQFPAFRAILITMDTIETISIDVYPWATPTDEQRAWFDALSPSEKRKAILTAIEEGFSSPPCAKSIEDIILEARAEPRHAS